MFPLSVNVPCFIVVFISPPVKFAIVTVNTFVLMSDSLSIASIVGVTAVPLTVTVKSDAVKDADASSASSVPLNFKVYDLAVLL